MSMNDDQKSNNSTTSSSSTSSYSSTNRSFIDPSKENHRKQLIDKDNNQQRRVVTVHNIVDCKLPDNSPAARVKKFNAFRNRSYDDKLSCATNITLNLQCGLEFTPEKLFSSAGLTGELEKLVFNSQEFKKLSQFGAHSKTKGYIVSVSCVAYGGDSPFQLLFGMKTCNDSIILLDKFSRPGTISKPILESAKKGTGCHLVIPSFNTRGFDYTDSIQRGLLNSLNITKSKNFSTNINNNSSSSSSSSNNNNNKNVTRNVITLLNPVHLNNIGENLQRLYNLFADIDTNSLNNCMMKFSMKKNTNTSMVLEHSLIGFAIKSRPDVRLVYCQPSKIQYSQSDDRFLCVDQKIIEEEYKNIMENSKVVAELGCHNVPSIHCTILPNQRWVFKDGDYYHPKHGDKYKIPKREKFHVYFNLKIVTTFYKPTTSAMPIVPFSKGIYPTPLWNYKDVNIQTGTVRRGASPLVDDISTQDRKVTSKIRDYKRTMNKNLSIDDKSTSTTVNRRNFSSNSSSSSSSSNSNSINNN
jgi:hypothetical protein